VKRAAARPVVITDAERSQDDQLRKRQIRYLIMMLIRAVCLVLAAVLVSVRAPWLPLWITLCVVAMILLPWLAVLLANDRPPKEQYRLSHRLGNARVPEPVPNTLAAKPEPIIIDAED
jgi:Flp pilus assembly protein TadB